MAYVGNTPTTQNFISGTDYFNGTGSQTAFTLSRTVASVNDIQAVVNNVVQVPNDAYTISGTTITFTSAPSAGTQNVYVRYLSTTTQAITPSQNTVSWNTLDTNTQNDLGLMGKNKSINGNMVINQRNNGGSVNSSAGGNFAVDRFTSFGSGGGVYTTQRSTDVPSGQGFVNSIVSTVTTTDSPTGTDYYIIQHTIEGFNTADLMWGTVNARTVTVSFWVKSSITGTYTVAFRNSGFNRSYRATYTINAANTWEYKTITVVGDTTGTWSTDNGIGIRIGFTLGAGSDFIDTGNVWSALEDFAATGQTQWIATNGATFYLTGVQLEVGTQATAFSTAGGSYGAELALCQRYYQFIGGTNSGFPLWGGYQQANDEIYNPISFPVQMRAAPTTTKAGTWNTGGLATQPDAIYINTQGFSLRVQKSASSGIFYVHPNSSDDIITFSAEL